MAGNELTKEMVDLIMKIKKHLKSEYQITIALADPELLGKLVKLKNMDDRVLQGMLTFLMALAGPEWSARFSQQNEPPAPSEPSAEKKRLFGFYRGKPSSTSDDIHGHKSEAAKHDETLYRGSHLGDETAPQEEPVKPRPVRYYRGQPVED